MGEGSLRVLDGPMVFITELLCVGRREDECKSVVEVVRWRCQQLQEECWMSEGCRMPE